jgi:hypothetical protein
MLRGPGLRDAEEREGRHDGFDEVDEPCRRWWRRRARRAATGDRTNERASDREEEEEIE